MLPMLLCTEAAVINAFMHLSCSLPVPPASIHPCTLITLNILSLCKCSCGNLCCRRLDGGVSSFTHDNCLVGLGIDVCIRTGPNLHLHPHLFLSSISNNPHVFSMWLSWFWGWGRVELQLVGVSEKIPSVQKTFAISHVCVFSNACSVGWFSFRI